jgi:hypothetical protein
MAGAALSGAVWFGFTNPERDKDDMLQPDDGRDQPFVQFLNPAAPVAAQSRANESPHYRRDKSAVIAWISSPATPPISVPLMRMN